MNFQISFELKRLKIQSFTRLRGPEVSQVWGQMLVRCHPTWNSPEGKSFQQGSAISQSHENLLLEGLLPCSQRT
jgi:hypothetical protein